MAFRLCQGKSSKSKYKCHDLDILVRYTTKLHGWCQEWSQAISTDEKVFTSRTTCTLQELDAAFRQKHPEAKASFSIFCTSHPNSDSQLVVSNNFVHICIIHQNLSLLLDADLLEVLLRPRCAANLCTGQQTLHNGEMCNTYYRRLTNITNLMTWMMRLLLINWLHLTALK